MKNRAYSTIEIKSIDEDKRIIEGIASTPSVDRDRDVIDTDGMEFKLPLPLLWQHRADMPIGTVEKAEITEKGLLIKCQIAPPEVDKQIEAVWRKIKAGLVRGFSIGFRSISSAWNNDRRGVDYIKVEVLEVSAVTIPANADATITSIKSASLRELSAIGNKAHKAVYIDTNQYSGASETNKEDNMTINEQIKSFEATRQAKAARMTELMNLSGKEGRTLNAEEAQEYDDIEIELKSIDEHLRRLQAQEKLEMKTAVPVTGVVDQETGSKVRGGAVISVKGANVEPGTAFVRYAIALVATQGNRTEALAYCKSQPGWKDQTPQVEKMYEDADLFRLTKAPGTTINPAFAGALVDYTVMASEFIDFLRPQTIIGRIDGLRRVPFNIQMPKQTGGSTSGWVGEGQEKPVTSVQFDTLKLGSAKSASIIVLSDELLRYSNPSVEAIVRQDLANAMVQFLDEQFINPTVAAVANVSPASITNGASNAAASGTEVINLDTDFKAAMKKFAAANIPTDGLFWIMRPDLAISISLIRNAFGYREFPDINADGGKLFGYTVITSNSARSGDAIILKPSEILLADDGVVSIDISKEASIKIASETVNLFQQNMVALRAERYINWARRRNDAVYYITGADYGAITEEP